MSPTIYSDPLDIPAWQKQLSLPQRAQKRSKKIGRIEPGMGRCGLQEHLLAAGPRQATIFLDQVGRQVEASCDAGAFSEEPTRDEVLDTILPIWERLTECQKIKIKEDLANRGINGGFFESLVEFTFQVVKGKPDRPYRATPAPSKQPIILAHALEKAVNATKGKKTARGDIGKVMRQYWNAQAPESKELLRTLLDEKGFSDQGEGIKSLINYAVFELDKLELIKDRENIWYPGKKFGPPNVGPPKKSRR